MNRPVRTRMPGGVAGEPQSITGDPYADYFHIEFSGEKTLARIVRAHADASGLKIDDDYMSRVIDCFLALREQDLQKPPATDELIAWVRALVGSGTKREELDSKKLSELPLTTAVLKLKEDWLLVHHPTANAR